MKPQDAVIDFEERLSMAGPLIPEIFKSHIRKCLAIGDHQRPTFGFLMTFLKGAIIEAEQVK